MSTAHSVPRMAPEGKVRWRIVGLIFLVYVLMFVDRINISIAAKHIIPEYGLTDLEFGSIFSAFVLGYALAQIPGGWLGDRFGPRRVMTWAIVWWSTFTAITALAGDLAAMLPFGVVASFAIVRALIGLGEAAAPPSGNRMIANWAAAQERGLATGVTLSGSALGAALTPPLIVWVMVTWGWREAFYVSGAAGVLVALIWYRLTADTPAEHPAVSREERAYIAGDEVPEESTAARRATPWRRLFARRDLWYLTGAYAVLGYNAYFYFAWFYLYLVNERGFSLERGGFYTMAPFLTMAVAGPIGGWLSDRLCQRYGRRGGRCGLGFTSMLLTGVFVYLGAATEQAVAAVVLLSLSTGTLLLGAAAFWATTIDVAQEHAGTVSGLMNMGGNLGGTLSPSLTPYLAEQHSWQAALYVMAALNLIGAVLWLGIHPERQLEPESASSLPMDNAQGEKT